MSVAEQTFLKSSEEYRATLRDGREVWYAGEHIDDVTTHFATPGGIDLIARAYDEQRAPQTRDVLTFVRDDGARISKAWMVPDPRTILGGDAG